MRLTCLGKTPNDKWKILRIAHRLMVDIKIKLNETGCEYDPRGCVLAPVTDAF
jgi:hypothetical protein